jgi:hypothetical protein
MPPQDSVDPVGQSTRTLQIIYFALVQGVLVFLIVTVAFARKGIVFASSPWELTSPFTILALVLAIGIIVSHILLPALVTARQRRALAKQEHAADSVGETHGLLAIHQTTKIISAALLEGGAFFCTIVYFLEGKAIPMLLAFALLGLIVFRFPLRSSVESWLATHRFKLWEDKKLG